MRRYVVLAAVAAIAIACGATGIDTGSNPSPSPGGGMHFDATANETVHEVSMRVGQRLEVALHATKGMSNWSHPTSNDESVLAATVDPAATAARYVTLAGFEARKPGQVEVTSYASPLCSPGQACPMYVALYSLMVTVTQ